MKTNSGVKKISILLLILTILLIGLNSCSGVKESVFDSNWMIDKNSEQIQEKFGKFNYASVAPNEEDGLYYDCECEYVMSVSEGLIMDGMVWKKYLVLYFNEDAVVYKTSEKLDYYKR